MGLIEERRARRKAQREALERAEDIVFGMDDKLRAHNPKAPVIDPDPEKLNLSSTQAITVDIEWLAALVSHAEFAGAMRITEKLQPLTDYTTRMGVDVTGDWRDALKDSVADNELRDILTTLLDAL